MNIFKLLVAALWLGVGAFVADAEAKSIPWRLPKYSLTARAMNVRQAFDTFGVAEGVPVVASKAVQGEFSGTFTDVPACFSCCLSDITWLGGESQGRKASAAEVFNDPKRPWHLRPGSPAVGVVSASAAGALPFVDLDGHARLRGRKLDLGCYECQVGGGLAILVR